MKRKPNNSTPPFHPQANTLLNHKVDHRQLLAISDFRPGAPSLLAPQSSLFLGSNDVPVLFAEDGRPYLILFSDFECAKRFQLTFWKNECDEITFAPALVSDLQRAPSCSKIWLATFTAESTVALVGLVDMSDLTVTGDVRLIPTPGFELIPPVATQDVIVADNSGIPFQVDSTTQDLGS